MKKFVKFEFSIYAQGPSKRSFQVSPKAITCSFPVATDPTMLLLKQ